MLVVSEKVKDIIARLYALRAGISVISMKRDEVEELSAEMKERKKNIEKSKADKKESFFQIDKKIERLRDDKNNLWGSFIGITVLILFALLVLGGAVAIVVGCYKYAFKDMSEGLIAVIAFFAVILIYSIAKIYSRKSIYDFRGVVVFIVKIILTLGVSIGLSWLGYRYWFKDTGMPMWITCGVIASALITCRFFITKIFYWRRIVLKLVMLVGVVGNIFGGYQYAFKGENYGMLIIIGVSFACFLCCFFYWWVDLVDDWSDDAFLRRYAPKEIENLENEQRFSLISMKKEERKYNEFSEKGKLRIQEIINECKYLYEALVKQFSSFLDVRDWKYTDLLIYYFETGRAETMKEALQQVDNERRNATLIKAVEAASDRICNTINDRAFELQQYMVQGFSIMAQGLEEMCATLINEIRAGQEAQRIQLAYIQQNLNQISDSNYMRNALIEKGNETSEKIMQDVDYMKTYGIKIL